MTQSWSMSTDCRSRCKQNMRVGRDASIDELLIQRFGRSKYTLQIPSQAATRRYKLSAICQQGYLIDFVFSSCKNRSQRFQRPKTSAPLPSWSNTSCMTYQREEALNISYIWTNFFTTVQLLVDLKNTELEQLELLKQDQFILNYWLSRSSVSKKDDWGMVRTMKAYE